MKVQFVEREFTVGEWILMNKSGRGDFEAGVMLVESRLAEPIPGLRDMPISDYVTILQQMMESAQRAMETSEALASINKTIRNG